MLDDAVTAIVLLLFLATAVERTVEVALAPFEGWGGPALRKVVAAGLALAAGAGFAFGLELDLVGPLLRTEAGEGLTAAQGRAATAIALAGGSAPAHELIRLIEETKLRAQDGPRA
jgi:hypothetical protein